MEDTIESVKADVFDALQRTSSIVSRSQLRSKPIGGGPFGFGAFHLASRWYVEAGLDAVSYIVMHKRSCAMLGSGSTKADALALARKVLQMLGTAAVLSKCEQIADELEAERKAVLQQQRKEREMQRARVEKAAPSIPKRRRQIFEASEGKCHYCSAALTLDGKWHIEHKMPRALMGSNEPSNLVASCTSCNHKKRDLTDVEFKARMQRARAVA